MIRTQIFDFVWELFTNAVGSLDILVYFMLLWRNKEQEDVEIIADPMVDCGWNFDNRASLAAANTGN